MATGGGDQFGNPPNGFNNEVAPVGAGQNPPNPNNLGDTNTPPFSQIQVPSAPPSEIFNSANPGDGNAPEIQSSLQTPSNSGDPLNEESINGGPPISGSGGYVGPSGPSIDLPNTTMASTSMPSGGLNSTLFRPGSRTDTPEFLTPTELHEFALRMEFIQQAPLTSSMPEEVAKQDDTEYMKKMKKAKAITALYGDVRHDKTAILENITKDSGKIFNECVKAYNQLLEQFPNLDHNAKTSIYRQMVEPSAQMLGKRAASEIFDHSDRLIEFDMKTAAYPPDIDSIDPRRPVPLLDQVLAIFRRKALPKFPLSQRNMVEQNLLTRCDRLISMALKKYDNVVDKFKRQIENLENHREFEAAAKVASQTDYVWPQYRIALLGRLQEAILDRREELNDPQMKAKEREQEDYISAQQSFLNNDTITQQALKVLRACPIFGPANTLTTAHQKQLRDYIKENELEKKAFKGTDNESPKIIAEYLEQCEHLISNNYNAKRAFVICKRLCHPRSLAYRTWDNAEKIVERDDVNAAKTFEEVWNEIQCYSRATEKMPVIKRRICAALCRNRPGEEANFEIADTIYWITEISPDVAKYFSNEEPNMARALEVRNLEELIMVYLSMWWNVHFATLSNAWHKYQQAYKKHTKVKNYWDFYVMWRRFALSQPWKFSRSKLPIFKEGLWNWMDSAEEFYQKMPKAKSKYYPGKQNELWGGEIAIPDPIEEDATDEMIAQMKIIDVRKDAHPLSNGHGIDVRSNTSSKSVRPTPRYGHVDKNTPFCYKCQNPNHKSTACKKYPGPLATTPCQHCRLLHPGSCQHHEYLRSKGGHARVTKGECTPSPRHIEDVLDDAAALNSAILENSQSTIEGKDHGYTSIIDDEHFQERAAEEDCLTSDDEN